MKSANCDQCNKTFEYNTKRSYGRFCSAVCTGNFQTQQRELAFWNGAAVARVTARKYIAAVRGYQCEVCGISDWQGKKLTLHVDHVNGDPSNSHHTNLRLLCPNCHSQTPFLGQANKGRGRGALGIKEY